MILRNALLLYFGKSLSSLNWYSSFLLSCFSSQQNLWLQLYGEAAPAEELTPAASKVTALQAPEKAPQAAAPPPPADTLPPQGAACHFTQQIIPGHNFLAIVDKKGISWTISVIHRMASLAQSALLQELDLLFVAPRWRTYCRGSRPSGSRCANS